MNPQFRPNRLALLALPATRPIGHESGLSPSVSLQLEWSPHLAALLGILALGVLGGLLTLRNRLERETSNADEPTVPHEEFMTDRERVCQLVEKNGGRMKQSEIVDSVDWSKAKVSRLLADLEDDGEITKLRLGRENLVCLSGHEPRASRSPERPNRE